MSTFLGSTLFFTAHFVNFCVKALQTKIAHHELWCHRKSSSVIKMIKANISPVIFKVSYIYEKICYWKNVCTFLGKILTESSWYCIGMEKQGGNFWNCKCIVFWKAGLTFTIEYEKNWSKSFQKETILSKLDKIYSNTVKLFKIRSNMSQSSDF